MPSIFLSPSAQEFNKFVTDGKSEEYYTNLIADAMEPYLTATGITYTRNNPNETLAQIIAQSNEGNYDLHLALHTNASPESLSGILRGADFYYYARSARGREAATVLADNYMNIYPDPSRVKIMPTVGLAEVVRTRAPSVLAELAYHDNIEDATWLTNNIVPIARNLVQGLAEFFRIPFVEPSTQQYYRVGRVRTDGGRLNIRKAPTLQGEVLGQAPNGAEIRVIGRIGDWFVVEYNGLLGFSAARYIDVIEPRNM
jgi:N-acetylmuramoyl-L-alanine amidase